MSERPIVCAMCRGQMPDIDWNNPCPHWEVAVAERKAWQAVLDAYLASSREDADTIADLEARGSEIERLREENERLKLVAKQQGKKHYVLSEDDYIAVRQMAAGEKANEDPECLPQENRGVPPQPREEIEHKENCIIHTLWGKPRHPAACNCGAVFDAFEREAKENETLRNLTRQYTRRNVLLAQELKEEERAHERTSTKLRAALANVAELKQRLEDMGDHLDEF